MTLLKHPTWRLGESLRLDVAHGLHWRSLAANWSKCNSHCGALITRRGCIKGSEDLGFVVKANFAARRTPFRQLLVYDTGNCEGGLQLE